MAWTRIVIRPDSIIRWWSLAQLDVVEGFSRVSDSPHLENINFRTLLAVSDGSEHVRTEEMATFGGGLVATSKENPALFQEIGRHYERVIGRWLRYAAKLSEEDHGGSSNAKLQRRFDRFIEYYKEFSPILFVPFIVENRYAGEYPALLDRISEQMLDAAKAASTSGATGLLVRSGAYGLADTPGELTDDLRAIIEYSPRRTIAEQKEHAVQQLAADIERSPLSALFGGDEPPTRSAFEAGAPEELRDQFVDVYETYKWLTHWGYPPLFSDATVDEYLAEVHARLQRGAVAALQRSVDHEVQAAKDHKGLLRLLDLNEADRLLIKDINYYNYLRTARMEAKIRAQYLSIPLLREIERRAIAKGLIDRDDIFLLVPPEIVNLLRRDIVPADLQDRRDGWILQTDAHSGAWNVLSGADRHEFESEFYGVIDWRENARGLHNPTAAFVGGKGAGLFDLVEEGHSVPPFLVVSSVGFSRFLDHNNLRPELKRLMGGLDQNDSSLAGKQASAASAEWAKLVEGAEIPAGLARAIQAIMPDLGDHPVAVRSSATVEDSATHSWAGRFDTVLDVAADDVLPAVKSVWASLCTERALLYALLNDLDVAEAPMAVVIQQMVPAETAGVINTALSGDERHIVEIEVARGYGAPLVDGEITPDRFLIDTNSNDIVDRSIGSQTRMLTAAGWTDLDKATASAPALSDAFAIELAQMAKRIERDLGGPQDIEFAIASDQVQIVQSRPLTGIGPANQGNSSDPAKAVPGSARLVASGLKGKTADVWTAQCQVLESLADGSRFEEGNILVLTAATPAWDPVIFKASALVTDDGGATSHAIRVANERGIPAIVGTNSGTEVIRDGSTLVLDTMNDPFKGRVFALEDGEE